MNHTPLADQRWLLAIYEEAYPADWPDRLARAGMPLWDCLVVGPPD